MGQFNLLESAQYLQKKSSVPSAKVSNMFRNVFQYLYQKFPIPSTKLPVTSAKVPSNFRKSFRYIQQQFPVKFSFILLILVPR